MARATGGAAGGGWEMGDLQTITPKIIKSNQGSHSARASLRNVLPIPPLFHLSQLSLSYCSLRLRYEYETLSLVTTLALRRYEYETLVTCHNSRSLIALFAYATSTLSFVPPAPSSLDAIPAVANRFVNLSQFHCYKQQQ